MLVAAIIGLLFGFIGSMPVAGPIAVLVFARGVDGRFRSALQIAIGSAIAEAAYAFFAFWGFAAFLARYSFIVPVSRALAAVILVGLGIAFMRRKHRHGDADAEADQRAAGPERLRSSFVIGFSVTALNPTLIATWTAATTTLFSTGVVTFRPAMAIPFGIGAAVGIVGWFAILLYLVRRYKGRFSQRTLTRIIRAMGVFLVGVGLVFLYAFVAYLLG